MKREGGSNFIDPFRGEPSSQLLLLRLSAFLFSAHSSELDALQIKNAAPPEVEQHLSCGEGGIRTHGTIASTRTFQARSFGHSDTSPIYWALFLQFLHRDISSFGLTPLQCFPFPFRRDAKVSKFCKHCRLFEIIAV